MAKRYTPEEIQHVSDFIHGLRADLPEGRNPDNIKRKFSDEFSELRNLSNIRRCAHAASIELVKAGAAKPFQKDRSILDGVEGVMNSVFCIDGKIGLGDEVSEMRRAAWEAFDAQT